MKCSLIFYVRIIQKECINMTFFKVILIHFYFDTKSNNIKNLVDSFSYRFYVLYQDNINRNIAQS